MIYIIVPTFGRVEHSRRLLTSVRAHFSDVQFIITDDHPDFPNFKAFCNDLDCTVLLSNTPRWWVGSINMGIDHLLQNCCDEDIVVFANNDVIIPKDGAFNEVIETLRSNLDLIIVPVTQDHNGAFISSGCQLKSLFPYYTIHPKNPTEDVEIDFATARFLMTTGKVIRTVGNINPALIQYHGDYYFSKMAQTYGIKTFISPRIRCIVDEEETGFKNVNIQSFSKFFYSLYSIRSANNIKYRYRLFRSFYSPLVSILIVGQMTAISFVRFVINSIK